LVFGVLRAVFGVFLLIVLTGCNSTPPITNPEITVLSGASSTNTPTAPAIPAPAEKPAKPTPAPSLPQAPQPVQVAKPIVISKGATQLAVHTPAVPQPQHSISPPVRSAAAPAPANQEENNAVVTEAPVTELIFKGPPRPPAPRKLGIGLVMVVVGLLVAALAAAALVYAKRRQELAPPPKKAGQEDLILPSELELREPTGIEVEADSEEKPEVEAPANDASDGMLATVSEKGPSGSK
jgi:hypothetical protein